MSQWKVSKRDQEGILCSKEHFVSAPLARLSMVGLQFY